MKPFFKNIKKCCFLKYLMAYKQECSFIWQKNELILFLFSRKKITGDKIFHAVYCIWTRIILLHTENPVFFSIIMYEIRPKNL